MGEAIDAKAQSSELPKLSVLPEGHDPFQPYKVEKFDEGLRYDTLQIHGGHRPDSEVHARAVPIYNSVVSLQQMLNLSTLPSFNLTPSVVYLYR